eukprot:IDg19830t1
METRITTLPLKCAVEMRTDPGQFSLNTDNLLSGMFSSLLCGRADLPLFHATVLRDPTDIGRADYIPPSRIGSRLK